MKTTISARLAAGMVGFALFMSATPALAHNNESQGWSFWNKWFTKVTATSTTATSTNSTYNVACVQAAVGAHEDANINALNTYNAAVSSALATRRNEMVAAWAQLNFTARIQAIRAAQIKYIGALKVAQDNLKTARTNANTTFKSAMTNCGATEADLSGKNHFEKKAVKEMKMEGWSWLGFNLGLNL